MDAIHSVSWWVCGRRVCGVHVYHEFLIMLNWLKNFNWRCRLFGWHVRVGGGFIPTIRRGDVVQVCICDNCGKQFVRVCG
jgi:hypothetical protein